MLHVHAPVCIDACAPWSPPAFACLSCHAHVMPDLVAVMAPPGCNPTALPHCNHGGVAIMVCRLFAISWHRLIAIMAGAQPSDCNGGASSDCNHGAPPGCNHWQRLHTDKIARWISDSHWICGAHDCFWRLTFQCAGAKAKCGQHARHDVLATTFFRISGAFD